MNCSRRNVGEQVLSETNAICVRLPMLKTLPTILEENATKCVFERAVSAWANGDIDAALKLMSDDVQHSVNVNGELVPFAASVRGKAQMRDKLRLLLETFEIGAYVTQHSTVEGQCVRARMKMIFLHKASGEQLNRRFRFVIEVRDGLLTHIEEYHDAAYLEAFARMVGRVDA